VKRLNIIILALFWGATLNAYGSAAEQKNTDSKDQAGASVAQEVGRKDCAVPTVVIESVEITPVTVDNYALAESQVIFTDYV
jgi:hypothetical protein